MNVMRIMRRSRLSPTYTDEGFDHLSNVEPRQYVIVRSVARF